MSEKKAPPESLTPEQPDDEILQLIRWIDKQQRNLFGKWDWLGNRWWISFVGLIVILAFILIYSILIFVDFLIHHIIRANVNLSVVAIALAFLAVAISYFSLVAQLGENNIVRVNFDNALKLKKKEPRQFNADEKILLKALIKIKAKNPEFKLEELYNKDKEKTGKNTLFVKKRLLEMLVE